MMNKKSAVLIYHRLGMGGIETLIVRAANELNAAGVDVTIFSRPGQLKTLLHKKIKFIEFDKYCDIYQYSNIISNETTLIAFDPLSYMVMRRLQFSVYISAGVRSKGHSGVFHPRSFVWGGDPYLVRFLNKSIFKLTVGNEFFFMSEAVRSATEKNLKCKNLLSNKILSLPISVNKSKAWDRSVTDQLKLVSVGRLVPFKAYNKAIPKIVSELVGRGINVRWDIWGDGDDFDSISNIIEIYNLQDRVFLRGVMPYINFKDAMLNYDLFLGMGTSALEAASIGLPTLCAVDRVSDECYGYLYETPSDCIGEHTDGVTYKPIVDCIFKHIELSASERKFVGERCCDAVSLKSGNGDYEKLLEAPSWPGSWINETLSLILSTPYLWAVDARKSRFFFRALRKIFS